MGTEGLTADNLLAGAAGALFGAAIGSCIPLWWTGRLRRIERRGELIGMQVEMYQANLHKIDPRNDAVLAPLYRLPLTIFKQALPKIIGEKGLTVNEIGHLVEYVNRIEELNRGLERAGNAHAARDEIVLLQEFLRNRTKAAAMVGESLSRFNDGPLFSAVCADAAKRGRRKYLVGLESGADGAPRSARD